MKVIIPISYIDGCKYKVHATLCNYSYTAYIQEIICGDCGVDGNDVISTLTSLCAVIPTIGVWQSHKGISDNDNTIYAVSTYVPGNKKENKLLDLFIFYNGISAMLLHGESYSYRENNFNLVV
jgi:hypothetical protein